MYPLPQISKLSGTLIICLLIFSTFARPLSNLLRAQIGGLGVAVILWIITALIGYQVINKLMKFDKLRLLIAALLTIITILYLASFEIAEERIHLIKFGILSFLIASDNSKFNLKLAIFYGFTIASLIGGLDEIWQHFLPGRVGDWRDVGFNAIGACWGILCYLLINFKRNKIN